MMRSAGSEGVSLGVSPLLFTISDRRHFRALPASLAPDRTPAPASALLAHLDSRPAMISVFAQLVQGMQGAHRQLGIGRVDQDADFDLRGGDGENIDAFFGKCLEHLRRDAGMEVVYEGIRLTPAQIVRAALDESVHVVGLSILSGSHVPLVRDVMERMRKEGLDDIPVVVGGIIPPEDATTLKALGVAAVYTPKDFQLTAIMQDIVRLIDRGAKAA